jgi:hypothetical protein
MEEDGPMSERDIEEPPDDVAEQSRSALADEDETAEPGHEVPLDVNEADAAEQSQTVDLDDDEYR